jgi:rare lipoprotein A
MQAETRAVASPRVLETHEGTASFVAQALHGRETASGEAFDAAALVAAHPSYPLGSLVRVVNLANGRSVEVRIVDRGPAAAARKEGVIIDVSPAAAETLGFVRDGRAPVRLEVLRWAEQDTAP